MTVLNSQLLEHGLVLDACKVATPFTFKGFLSRLLKGADIWWEGERLVGQCDNQQAPFEILCGMTGVRVNKHRVVNCKLLHSPAAAPGTRLVVTCYREKVSPPCYQEVVHTLLLVSGIWEKWMEVMEDDLFPYNSWWSDKGSLQLLLEPSKALPFTTVHRQC